MKLETAIGPAIAFALFLACFFLVCVSARNMIQRIQDFEESCERWRDQRDPGLSDRTGVPLSGKIWRGAHCPEHESLKGPGAKPIQLTLKFAKPQEPVFGYSSRLHPITGSGKHDDLDVTVQGSFNSDTQRMVLRLRYKHHSSKRMTLRLKALRVPLGSFYGECMSSSGVLGPCILASEGAATLQDDKEALLESPPASPRAFGPGALAKRSAEAMRAGLASITERYETGVAKRIRNKEERKGGALLAVDEESPAESAESLHGAERKPADPQESAGPPQPSSPLFREDTYIPPACDVTRPCGFGPGGGGGGGGWFFMFPGWNWNPLGAAPPGGTGPSATQGEATANRGGAASPFSTPNVPPRRASSLYKLPPMGPEEDSPSGLNKEEKDRRAEAEAILDVHTDSTPSSPRRQQSILVMGGGGHRAPNRSATMGDGGGNSGRLKPPQQRANGHGAPPVRASTTSIPRSPTSPRSAVKPVSYAARA